MPRIKILKNRFCRNSKLTEDEFRYMVWGFVHVWNSAWLRKRMLEDQGLVVSERTALQYYRRIGRYLFRALREDFIAEVAPELSISQLSEDEKEKVSVAIFERAFDQSLGGLNREEYLTLRGLNALPKDYALPALRIVASGKRGITRSKVEHVALTYFLAKCHAAMEMEKVPMDGQPQNQLNQYAYQHVIEALRRRPL